MQPSPKGEGAPRQCRSRAGAAGAREGPPGRYLRSAARPGLLAAASGGRGGAGLAGAPPPGRAVSGPSCRRSRPEPGSSPAPARVGGSAGAGPPGPSARRPPAAARPAPRRPSRGRGRCRRAGRRVGSPPGTPRRKQGRPRDAREAGVRICSPRLRHRAVPVPAVSPAALETVYVQSVRDPAGSEVTGFKNITPPQNFCLRSRMTCLSFKQFSSDFPPRRPFAFCS